MDINLEELRYVTYACFVLHNYCEVNNDKIGDDKVLEAVQYDKYFQPSQSSNNYRMKDYRLQRV